MLTWQIDIIFHSKYYIGQLSYYFSFYRYLNSVMNLYFLDGFRSIKCISVISFVGISSKLLVKHLLNRNIFYNQNSTKWIPRAYKIVGELYFMHCSMFDCIDTYFMCSLLTYSLFFVYIYFTPHTELLPTRIYI